MPNEKENDERTQMMSFVLNKYRQKGKKFVLGKNFREETTKPKKKVVVRKEAKRRIFKEVPSLDELKDIDPSFNVSKRNFLFDAGMVSILNQLIETMQVQGYPRDIIQKSKDLAQLMMNNETEEVKEKTLEIAENGCASTSSNDVSGYHLLRAFIRLMIATYPMED